MISRSLCIGAAAGALVLGMALSPQASAAPGAAVAGAAARPKLLQLVGSKYRWHRQYDRDHGVYVRAPFTDVDTHHGTHVEERAYWALWHLGAGAFRESLRPALSFATSPSA